MKIYFLGGTDEVGASCLLLEMDGQRILVDAGIRVSPKVRDGLTGEMLPDLSPLNDADLSACFITHAHADHIGAMPLVLGARPDVPTYATPATIALMQVMLSDSLRIMDTRAEEEDELPKYDELQVERTMEALIPLDIREPVFIGGLVRVTFYRAGHIPGAVSIFFESAEGTILVSGDLSFSPMRATPSAEVPPVRPDILITESTYGGKMHANRRAEEIRLVDSIMDVVNRGGRALIPAFALGRAQEVALILDAAMDNGTMPHLPVYMDGMTRAITRVFQQFPTYLSEPLAKHIQKQDTIWRSTQIKFVKNMEDRLRIAHSSEPCVIVASSGMMTGGASAAYAEHVVREPQSAIFITGYQDEESPGRHLQRLVRKGGGKIHINGRTHEVECRVDTYSLSAHADENELTQYAAQLSPQYVYLVHGDGDARSRMVQLLRERQLRVGLPRLAEVVEPEVGKSSSQQVVEKRGVGVASGEDFSIPVLWQLLIDNEMGGTVLSLHHLVMFWYGEEQSESVIEAFSRVLEADLEYFSASPRKDDSYRVLTVADVRLRHRRQKYLDVREPLVKRKILMQSGRGKPYLAFCTERRNDAVMVVTTTQTDQYSPAERIVLMGDALEDVPPQLALQDMLFQEEQAIAEASKTAFDIAQLAVLSDGEPRTLKQVGELLNINLDDTNQRMAMAWRLIDFGAEVEFSRYKIQAREEGPLIFNHARELIMEMIPDEARLRKLSPNFETNTITMRFDFPHSAGERFRDYIEKSKLLTGWNMEVSDSVNQMALTSYAKALVPTANSSVSLHMGEMAVEVAVPETPDDWETLQETFQQETGFELRIKLPSMPQQQAPQAAAPSANQMEINAAYGLIRAALEPKGLYKVGLKQGELVLSFITPQVGARHQDEIDQLAEQVGYPIKIHPHPNQNAVLDLLNQLAYQHNIQLTRNPALRIDTQVAEIHPVQPIPEDMLAQIQAEFAEQTAYELRV